MMRATMVEAALFGCFFLFACLVVFRITGHLNNPISSETFSTIFLFCHFLSFRVHLLIGHGPVRRVGNFSFLSKISFRVRHSRELIFIKSRHALSRRKEPAQPPESQRKKKRIPYRHIPPSKTVESHPTAGGRGLHFLGPSISSDRLGLSRTRYGTIGLDKKSLIFVTGISFVGLRSA